MRSRSVYTLLVALFLTALALAIFVHKLTALNIPVFPNQSNNNWFVEAKLTLNGKPTLISQLSEGQGLEAAQLKLHLPQNSQHYTVVDESFEGQHLESPSALKSQIKNDNANRIVVLQSPELSRHQTLFYRATVRSSMAGKNRSQPEPLGLQILDQQIEPIDRSADEIEETFKDNISPKDIKALLHKVRASSSDDLAFARQLYRLTDQLDNQQLQNLQARLPVSASSIELTAFLLKEAGITARVGNGILLEPEQTSATQSVARGESRSALGHL